MWEGVSCQEAWEGYTRGQIEAGESKEGEIGQRLSRAECDAAFAAASQCLHRGLEDWYDRHADASLGEIEQEARRLRRAYYLCPQCNGQGILPSNAN